MASAIKVCRVCGGEYEACRSTNRSAGVFRWQEVACSPECGAAYLEKINESRGLVPAQKKGKSKKRAAKPEAAVEEQVVLSTVETAGEAPVVNE